MWSVSGLQTMLRRSHDEIVALIEEGKLRWSFDVGVRGRRHDLRILSAAVDAFVVGRECQLEWRDVAPSLVPGNGAPVSTPEVCGLLVVSNDHVFNLLKAKQIQAVSSWRRGPGGAAKIAAKSLLDFLARRCWPVPVNN
jgi:hypothetical protein